jgi:FMN-dependent NADH-azoreductase
MPGHGTSSLCMKTLLHIDSSPRTSRSFSRQLTAHFVATWRKSNPTGEIVHRDLGLNPVPPVSEDWIAAAFSNPAGHSPGQKAAIAVSNELVDELLAADEIVIGAPMYNFAVNASLKAWIDQVVRIGRTVGTSSPSGVPAYTGLVRAKKATIITTRGGAQLGPGEAMAHLDAQVPYLKQILGFIGITDISVVYAGGLAGTDEACRASLKQAFAEVENLATRRYMTEPAAQSTNRLDRSTLCLGKL